jgi:hypothetical protein
MAGLFAEKNEGLKLLPYKPLRGGAYEMMGNMAKTEKFFVHIGCVKKIRRKKMKRPIRKSIYIRTYARQNR